MFYNLLSYIFHYQQDIAYIPEIDGYGEKDTDDAENIPGLNVFFSCEFHINYFSHNSLVCNKTFHVFQSRGVAHPNKQ